jgi:ribonuclease P/MRP protein subunit RPP40
MAWQKVCIHFLLQAGMAFDVELAGMPLKKHHPQVINCEPVRVDRQNILTPSFHTMGLAQANVQDGLQDDCGSLSEWLAMVALDSPRVSADDSVDPYLSRYTVPDVDRAKPSNLVSLRWHGLAPSRWVMQLFFALQ